MINIPLVDLKRQYNDHRDDFDSSISKVLKKSNFILGEEVEEFEEAFAKYCGVKYCVGVASGTDAILLGLSAIGVKNGDEVITQANTFISTILPIISLGAKPVLVDINPNTYQIDVSMISKAISKKTRAILPVHLYGYPAPMREISQIASNKHIEIVEDACQAHGTIIENKKAGSFGVVSAFSFYPGKNLGAFGDGGAVVTNSSLINKKIKILRNIGQTKKYKHDLIGFNSRLDTLQASVLSLKLKHLDAWNIKRRRIAKLYSKLLRDLPLVLPPDIALGNFSNYHLYVIRTAKRDKLMNFLSSKGVHCGIHYPIPLHMQKSVNKILGYQKNDFPLTEKYSRQILSLPIFPELKEQEVEQICKLITIFFNRQ